MYSDEHNSVPQTASSSNPVPELLDDDTFRDLAERKLLDRNGLRNYLIRRRFWAMRADGVPAAKALERLHEDFSYLQFDTLRKLVYRVRKK